MEINRYLFGFEFQCLCINCPGAVWYVASYSIKPILHVPICGLCANRLLDPRIYARWT